MRILINREAQHTDSSSTLFQVLTENRLLERKGIAVAINQQIIPKTLWDKTHIKENDHIIVIQATQGG